MSKYELPDFSIVIPTYRRPGCIADLLFSLTRISYPSTMFEIIVVDDGGGVPLEPLISRFRGQLNLTLLIQENTGPAGARNYGAVRADGRYLAFTDDDCMADPGWLHALAEGFRQYPHSVCGGRTVNACEQNPYSTASQLLMDYLYEHYNPIEKTGGFYPTNNLAVPRQAFLEMGGFDPSLRFGEDRDFCYRWASDGSPFVFAPEAVVYHVHSMTLFSLMRLHFCYGGGSFQFRRRCTMRGLSPVKLSPVSWYLDLLLSGVRKSKGMRGMLLTFLLTGIQAANTAGFFWNWYSCWRRQNCIQP